jgi:hypothetical protein
VSSEILAAGFSSLLSVGATKTYKHDRSMAPHSRQEGLRLAPVARRILEGPLQFGESFAQWSKATPIRRQKRTPQEL